MIIRDLRFINIYIAWLPMVLLESGSWETWRDMVTNEHLVKCVKACLIDIQFAKCQNCMETRQCKYCLSIRHETCWICTWNGYGVRICTPNYTVVYFSKTKSESEGQKDKNKGEECVVHVVRKNDLKFACHRQRHILKFWDVFSCRMVNMERQLRHQGCMFAY